MNRKLTLIIILVFVFSAGYIFQSANAVIAFDTSNTNNVDGATTVTITVGSNNNRLLILDISYAPASGSAAGLSVTSVTDTTDGKSFTRLLSTIGNGVGSMKHDIWYLTSTNGLGTGAKTITIVKGGSWASSIMGVTSLYNVNQVTPINNSTTTINATTTQTTQGLRITPTTSGSWIMSFVASEGGALDNPNHTSIYSVVSSAIYLLAQYFSSPVISSANDMTWQNHATPGSQTAVQIDTEIRAQGTLPPTPTLSKVNTINNTAINATWASSSGATWYLLNTTLSGGATTHINTTNTFSLLNNYTAGSKYTFSLIAGNGSGKSSVSLTKYNYTKNIAPTGLGLVTLSSNSARVSVTNPSGNFSGYKIEKESPDGGGFSTVTSNTGNTTNRYDFTGLTPNTQYNVRFSTNYAFGSNYSGTSSPSANFSFYTSSPPVGGKTQGFYVTRNSTSEPLYSTNLIGYWKFDERVTSPNPVGAMFLV